MKHASPQISLIALVTAIPLSLFTACGGDTIVRDESLTVDTAIEGTVIDGLTREPIEGATVTAPGTTTKDAMKTVATATTDANGFYRIPVSGLGDHVVFVERSGYAKAKYRVRTTVEPGAPGNLGLNAVADSKLYPKTGTLVGRVSSGGPRNVIKGARVVVQFTDGTDPIEDSSLDTEETTDDNGNFTLKGLPAGSPQTRVIVYPVDLDDDDEPDTATYSDFVKGGPGTATLVPDSQNYMEITVDQFIADKVIWSSLDDDAIVAPDAALTLAFARPMLTTWDATQVALRVGGGQAEFVSAEREWSSDGTELTVTPREALVPGEDYTLEVTAHSANGSSVTFSRAFVVQSADAPEDAVDSLELVDEEPFPWTQRAFRLTWQAQGAESYRVLARNNANQSTWVTLFQGRASAFTTQRATVTLPDAFNTFPGEGVFSATGFGTEVEFAVQPFNGKNDGPFPDEVLTIKDSVCPKLQVAQTGTATNQTEAAIKFQFVVSSTDNEPLSEDSVAKFSFKDGAGTDAFVLKAAPKSQRWINRSSIEYTFEVPALKSATGDSVSINLLGVTDTSGNAPNEDEDDACRELVEIVVL